MLEQLKKLQSLMKENDIAIYILPTSDYHSSEYIGDYFKCRQYMSNFTGSNGTLVVCLDSAYLFTDGRYFIQAEHELQNTEIILMKMGEENVPSLEDFVEKKLMIKQNIGFDGKVMTTLQAKKFEKIVSRKNGKLIFDKDLVGIIWKDRPQLSKEKVFSLDITYSGKSTKEKIEEICLKLEKLKAKNNLITSLDDIAWILNLRGNDITFNPVFLSYLIINTSGNHHLFIEKNKLNEEVIENLEKNNISIHKYNDIIDFIKTIKESILIDPNKVSYTLYKNLNTKIIEDDNPSLLLKAIKNDIEIENLKKVHLIDGIAMTKFMYWLKKSIGNEEIDELSVANKLLEFRKLNPHFIEPSFNTICAYNANAAMMHYSATIESFSKIEKKGMLLIDSGGQYYEGTTDITRTFILGEVSREFKMHFTTILQSVLNLSSAKFLYGVRGTNLDILARGPIWDLLLDYKCGTGHGVGYLLNVHEAPNGFRWKSVPERNDSCILEAGMITTNEPGIYLENKYGIRHEQEMLCIELDKNEYGNFLGFETLTLCPIDLEGILPELLTTKQKEQLNEYHLKVFNKLSPFMDDNEKEWLKKVTKKI
ncbi:MAG: aminopeptidase P family protein [Bacilli bacterium]|nr:aminopeptidase P family protein [Bacilli bacterium]